MFIKRKEIIEELQREKMMRQKVYPYRIQTGKLNEDRAKIQNKRLDKAIFVFEHLSDRQYQKLIDMIEEKIAAKERQGSLF